ncbi:RGD1564712 [Phodopus roborovskii]|uniref:RGD1564712 protein n=1 Tax=Phodopus roborovskii TaxID=109678 RepID=A0AAV0A9T1_PHORO|nr:RGD1564712 [Phodopus roborovskii]
MMETMTTFRAEQSMGGRASGIQYCNQVAEKKKKTKKQKPNKQKNPKNKNKQTTKRVPSAISAGVGVREENFQKRGLQDPLV